MEPHDGGTRERIVAAALDLLAAGGSDAVSTRAVSSAAGVAAPAIYRLFGDKQGLLDAAADRGFRAYLVGKEARAPADDPVDGLRRGWDAHIAFALSNPALYRLVYERSGTGGSTSAAATAASGVLARHVADIARAGRLRVHPDLAVDLLHAAGRGVALTLVDAPDAHRDPALSTAAREAVVAAITTGAPVVDRPGPAPAALALAVALPDVAALSPVERALLGEWLDRIARDPAGSAAGGVGG